VKCTPNGGQVQAAVLTGCWAWRSIFYDRPDAGADDVAVVAQMKAICDNLSLELDDAQAADLLQEVRHTNIKRRMSALPPKADIAERDWDVRFVLSTQSVDAIRALNLVPLGSRSPKSRATVH
jgi:hypothetical protein